MGSQFTGQGPEVVVGGLTSRSSRLARRARMLKCLARRSLIVGGGVVVVGLAVGVQCRWLSGAASRTVPVLRMDRGWRFDSSPIMRAQSSQVVPDDLRRKYDPTRRMEFQVVTSQMTSVFVL